MFEFVQCGDNQFYSVNLNDVTEAEKEVGISFPSDLMTFYREVGFGFFKTHNDNINRLMDPMSMADFRLRTGDFEAYTELESYGYLEVDKLIFFEVDSDAYISIGFTEGNQNQIFYDEFKIAGSLKEFLEKIMEDDNYYLDIPS